MSCPGGFAADLPGTAATAGPSVESVLVVAERLSGVARELNALRLQLCGLDSVDWNSAAAAAFRKSLAENDAEFAAAGRRVEAAVAELGSYGAYLRVAADSGAAAGPDRAMVPGFAPAWGGAIGAGRGGPISRHRIGIVAGNGAGMGLGLARDCDRGSELLGRHEETGGAAKWIT